MAPDAVMPEASRRDDAVARWVAGLVGRETDPAFPVVALGKRIAVACGADVLGLTGEEYAALAERARAAANADVKPRKGERERR
ncbi:hypothetical protein [Krasilnikovia cinnamomea]|uniref:hypothetical protein n=1 Tax=Krasilnikovia cinnamomea TaxID=349313 RepID=UPI00102B2C41|nr:hypothetical protein [Krasilnikovia cinnamomea]